MRQLIDPLLLATTSITTKFTIYLVYHVCFIFISHLSQFFVVNEVYAWGNNAMGQCGQGHYQSPVTVPKKVLGLEGVAVQQISAGTSHSLAWTTMPTDR